MTRNNHFSREDLAGLERITVPNTILQCSIYRAALTAGLGATEGKQLPLHNDPKPLSHRERTSAS